MSIEVVLLHGTGGNPDINWLPSIRKKLLDLQVDVYCPQLPPPEEQSLQSWTQAFEDKVGALQDGMIIIGHSMGVGFALRLIEKFKVKIPAVFLVSGWDGLLGSEYFDPLISTFYENPFNYEFLNDLIGEAYCYHGINDSYVPIDLGRDLANKLHAKLFEIPNGGHLNEEANFLTFPDLERDVVSFISDLS